jgi:uncharacterized protein YjbI with pentapeptide repeats
LPEGEALPSLGPHQLRPGVDGDGGRRPALEDLNQDQEALAAAPLSKAYLFEVQLPAAQRQAADLAGAILSKANLPKATLLEANLAEAHLMGAKLSRANLSEDYLGGIEPNRGQSLQGQPERSSTKEGALLSDRDAGGQHQQRPLPDRTRAAATSLADAEGPSASPEVVSIGPAGQELWMCPGEGVDCG